MISEYYVDKFYEEPSEYNASVLLDFLVYGVVDMEEFYQLVFNGRNYNSNDILYYFILTTGVEIMNHFPKVGANFPFNEYKLLLLCSGKKYDPQGTVDGWRVFASPSDVELYNITQLYNFICHNIFNGFMYDYTTMKRILLQFLSGTYEPVVRRICHQFRNEIPKFLCSLNKLDLHVFDTIFYRLSVIEDIIFDNRRDKHLIKPTKFNCTETMADVRNMIIDHNKRL